MALGKSLFFLANPSFSFPLSQFHLDSCKLFWVVTGFPLLFLPGFPVWSLILKGVSRCNCDANKERWLHWIYSTYSNYRKTFYLEIFLLVWEYRWYLKKKWIYFYYNQLGGNPLKKLDVLFCFKFTKNWN